MNSLIRVCCISARVHPVQPDACVTELLRGIDAVRESAPDLLVLPAFALGGAAGGGLCKNAALLDAARIALDRLCLATTDLSSYVVVGLLVDDWGKPAPVCAVLHSGRLLGFVPAHGAPALSFHGEYSNRVLPAGTVFSVGKCRFTVLSCPPEELLLHTAELAATGCDLVVCPTYTPVCAGAMSENRRTLRFLTKTLGCAAALCNGGTGDSSSTHLFWGFSGVYECGEELRFISHKSADATVWGESTMADIDTDLIGACKRGGNFTEPFFSADVSAGKSGILRRISQNPFLACPNRDAYVAELFWMQAAALAVRLQNSGIGRMVLGVSGGLDSTLALLVAVRAADDLGLSRRSILGVTMPGFGTTDRTYHNAVMLMERLGCEMAEIPIGDACIQHLKAIGHDTKTHDITYENVQARERTQILLDLANRVNGLVLGTGDLSEAALGWCTFGGDQLAGYNVNMCLTKNMVRAVVKHVADSRVLDAPALPPAAGVAEPVPLGLNKPQSRMPPASVTGGAPDLRRAGLGATLADILETPVSPELLPAENGKTAQRTEDILGTYDLHDFFAYYFIRYGFGPTKLFRYACVAFGAQMTPAEVKEKLLLFLRRFFGAQFKRACAPDAAAFTEVNLLSARFTMPSDVSPEAFLEETMALPLT